MKLTSEYVLYRIRNLYNLIDLFSEDHGFNNDQKRELHNAIANMALVLGEEFNAPYFFDYVLIQNNTPETCAKAVFNYWKEIGVSSSDMCSSKNE